MGSREMRGPAHIGYTRRNADNFNGFLVSLMPKKSSGNSPKLRAMSKSLQRMTLPSSNRSHAGEDLTDDYFGP
jgi:hypothetical protein